MSELKLYDIWDDTTNAVCQAMQENKMCKCKDGECLAAKIKPSAETVRHWNTRAVSDVPELVTVGHLWEYAEYYRDDRGYYGYVKIITEENPSTHVSPASKIRHHRELVARDQAAEIIRSMIPRVNNCGRYIAERNDGTLMYLNHGNTWQGCDNFISAKDKEIERLKNLIDGDDCPDPDKIDALFRRAEAAEAELAQYEAQEPVAYRYQNCFGGEPLSDHMWQYASFPATKRGNATNFVREPLYASPAPAADLKSENERHKQALEFYADKANWESGDFQHSVDEHLGHNVLTLNMPHAINDQGKIARAALKVEASNDKR